jgi:hypothetical protein
MPGLVPGIHVLLSCRSKDLEGRDKPGHDQRGVSHVGFTASTKLVSMKLAKSGTRLICFSASMWSA